MEDKISIKGIEPPCFKSAVGLGHRAYAFCSLPEMNIEHIHAALSLTREGLPTSMRFLAGGRITVQLISRLASSEIYSKLD